MSFSNLFSALAHPGKHAKPVALGALCLGLAGFWCLRQWDSPAAGPASTSAKVLGGSVTVNTPDQPAVVGGPATDPMTDNLADRVASADPVADWMNGPIVQPERDLFFSRSLVLTPIPSKATPPIRPDDDTEQRKTAAFRLAAAELKLTSVVGGASGPGANAQPPTPPMALLNGRWVTTGDEVDGFKVVRIGPRLVIVERGGRRLEVRMK